MEKRTRGGYFATSDRKYISIYAMIPENAAAVIKNPGSTRGGGQEEDGFARLKEEPANETTSTTIENGLVPHRVQYLNYICTRKTCNTP